MKKLFSWPSFKVKFMLILLIQHTLRHLLRWAVFAHNNSYSKERRRTHARHTAQKAEGRPPLVIYFEGQ